MTRRKKNQNFFGASPPHFTRRRCVVDVFSFSERRREDETGSLSSCSHTKRVLLFFSLFQSSKAGQKEAARDEDAAERVCSWPPPLSKNHSIDRARVSAATSFRRRFALRFPASNFRHIFLNHGGQDGGRGRETDRDMEDQEGADSCSGVETTDGEKKERHPRRLPLPFSVAHPPEALDNLDTYAHKKKPINSSSRASRRPVATAPR